MHGPCCRLGRLPLLPPTLCGDVTGHSSAAAPFCGLHSPQQRQGPSKAGARKVTVLNSCCCSRALRASSRASYSALVPKFFVRWRLRTDCLHVVLRFAGRAPTSSPGCRNLEQATARANSRSRSRWTESLSGPQAPLTWAPRRRLRRRRPFPRPSAAPTRSLRSRRGSPP